MAPEGSQTTPKRVAPGTTRRRFLTAAGSAVLVAACTPSVTAPAGSRASTPQPKKGGTLNITGDSPAAIVASFDPHTLATSESMLSLMFDGLVSLEPNASISPALAESWSASGDGRTYTFKLRGGVTFHNGRPLTAGDVTYSFNRILDPATKHPTRSAYASIATVQSTDAMTVVITLKQRDPSLLFNLAAIGASIVPQEEVQKGNFGERPIGTGPFRFGERTVGQFLLLEANKTYREAGFPLLDRVRFVGVSDKQATISAILAGQLDFFRNAPIESYTALQPDPTIQMYTGDGYGYAWMILNDNRVAAFKDVRVRQAINWALNRKEIADLAWPNLSTPLFGSLLPVDHPAGLKDPVYPQQDLAKAKQLLQQAGNGSGVEFTCSASGTFGAGHYPRALQVIQSQLAQANIKMNISIDPPGVAQAGPFLTANQALYMGAVPDPNPDAPFETYFMPGGARNYLNWNDPTLVGLITRARESEDVATRNKLYQDAQRYVAMDSRLIAPYIRTTFDVVRKDVRGWVFNAPTQGSRGLTRVWLDR